MGGGCVIFHYMNIPQFIYPSCCWWIFGFFAIWGSYKSCSYKQSCMCLLVNMGTHQLGVDSLGLWADLCSAFIDNAQLFPKCVSLYSHLHCINFHGFTFDQYLVLSNFKTVAILGVCNNSIALWFKLHFPVTNAIGHLFICLLVIWIVSFMSWLFKFIAHLFYWALWCFLTNLFGYKSFLIDVINAFSHSMACLSTFLTLLFDNKQFPVLRKTKIVICG